MLNQAPDTARWTRPENQTMPWVHIAWFKRGVDELLQNRVQRQAREGWVHEAASLFGIAFLPMILVSGLDLCLGGCQQEINSHDLRTCVLTAWLSHSSMRVSYGLAFRDSMLL